MDHCPACAIAADNPRTGHYHAGCVGCAARAVAQSPLAREAQRSKRQSAEYVELLRRALPKIEQAEAHERVKAWLARLYG